MDHSQVNLLHELDSLSRIHTLKRADIDNLMIEFARRILVALRIDRMSVWLCNQEKDTLVSIGEYTIPDHRFTKGSKLLSSKYPKYHKAIHENEILLAPNIYTHEATSELSEDYSRPNNVISLMDVPLRIEGDLIGVMCFEKTGKIERVFNKDEQVFALSIAIVFASNMEARQRRALQHKLDEEIREKEILLRELNHRVRNNLSVISSLVRLQSYKVKDDFHKALFEDCYTKIDSIAGIHELVYSSQNYSIINARDYFTRLLNNISEFFSSVVARVRLQSDIQEISIDVDQALPMALIANEVVTNAYKHAFEGVYERNLNFSLKTHNFHLIMKIQDNGKGFNAETIESDTLGLEIVKGLVEQLDAEYEYSMNQGTTFILTIPYKQIVSKDEF
jgi:two-component sensor histidine kinase